MTIKKKLIKNGIRPDGRKLDEMREIEAKVGVIPQADGSAKFRFGKTTALAAVYGPLELHPRRLRETDVCVLVCKYTMVPFSTDDRIRPGHSRRATEIGLVIKEALEPVVFLENFPNAGIKIYVDILQADASTRCAAINAASLALADAGIPMRDLVSSVSVGKVEDQLILDVAGDEDCEGEVDLPIAYIQKENAISLIQMDGLLSQEKFKQGIKLAIKACKEIRKIQEKALLSKYRIEAKSLEETKEVKK